MRGPHDVDGDAPAPHGTGEAAPWIVDGRSVCLTCHDAMHNAQDVATCTTGPEHLEAGTDVSCAGCHMPFVEQSSGVASNRPRHRSHAFLGPHRSIREDTEGEGFASSHLLVRPALESGTLSAAIENRSGHAMPTGFPGRTILVRAVGYDAAGEAVWRSFRDDPLEEDPQSVLHRAYVDADGQPTLPPYGARLARDTRLRPGEARTLSWPVPEEVVHVEVALLYRLLPPAAAQRIGVADPRATAPRTLLTASTP
jgi:hypothetical protein